MQQRQVDSHMVSASGGSECGSPNQPTVDGFVQVAAIRLEARTGVRINRSVTGHACAEPRPKMPPGY